MKRRLLESNSNGKSVRTIGYLRRLPLGELGSLMGLRLVAADAGLGAKRHLTEQQLVDFAIGASSRAGRLSVRHHLAGCALCREDLDNLRGVDRQLEVEGGGCRLASIPGMVPNAGVAFPRAVSADGNSRARPAEPMPPRTAVRGQEEIVGALTTALWWPRVVLPLMAAVCILSVVTIAVYLPQAAAPTQDRDIAVAESVPEYQPVANAYDLAAPSWAHDIEATPAAVEFSAPAVASTEYIADTPGMARDEPKAVPRTARLSPSVRRPVDVPCRVTRQRHPGAGRNDDRISPPRKEMGV